MAVLLGLVKLVGLVYVFFLPGFVLSYVLFSKREMEGLERGVLSVALSIGTVVLSLFWLSWLLDVKINFLNICLVASGLVLMAGAGLYVKRRSSDSCSGTKAGP